MNQSPVVPRKESLRELWVNLSTRKSLQTLADKAARACLPRIQAYSPEASASSSWIPGLAVLARNDVAPLLRADSEFLAPVRLWALVLQ